MLRILLCSSIVLLLGSTLHAQQRTFGKVSPSGEPLSRFATPKVSGFGFGDFNGDGFDDAVISGQGEGYNLTFATTIYLNDGNGGLGEGPYQCLPDAWGRPHFTWDVDNDGDIDLLVCNLVNGVSAELYLNDGFGYFDLDTSTTFPVLYGATVFVEDLNGDGEKDVLITGAQNQNGGNTVFKLYSGSASGNFTELTNSLTPHYRGAIDVADFDADGDNDIVIVGEVNGSPSLKLYLNQGNFSFSEMTHFMWPAESPQSNNPLERADVKFGDVNGDAYLDLAVLGLDHNGDSRTSVYTSNFGNSFTELSIPNLTGLESGEIYIVEVTGDALNDIVVRGHVDYWNDEAFALEQTPTGWSPLPNIGLDALEQGISAMHDIDHDGDLDFFSSGNYRTPHVSANAGRITRQYMNNQDGTFSLAIGTQFDSKYAAHKSVADFNGDGYMDFILSKQVLPNHHSVSIYLNNQDNTFSEATTNISHVVDEVWAADFNGDGYQDLVASIRTGNDRLGVFLGTSSIGVYSNPIDYALYDYEGDLHLEDVNLDGHMDICYFEKVGFNNPFELTFLLNDGSGVFSKATTVNAPIIDRLDAEVQYADFNLDGKLDVFVSSRLAYTGEAYLYLQDSFAFTVDTAFSFPSVPASNAESAIGDFDGNGLLDVVLIGDLNGGTGGGLCHVILQDSIGYYSAHYSSNLPVLEWGTLDTADVDLDGDLDLLHIGYFDPTRTYIRDVHINDGTGTFSPGGFVDIEFVHNSWFMDTDNDGDQDIVQAGRDIAQSIEIGAVLENRSCSTSNTVTQISVCEPYEWPVTGCTYFESGTYTYAYFNSNGCYVSESLEFTYEGVEAEIQLHPDTGLSSIGSFDSYQWLACDSVITPLIGDTLRSFTPARTGQYALVVSNGICSDTSECVQFNYVGNTEYAANQLIVSPNPTNGKILIEGLDEECTYEIYDIRGSLIQRGAVEPSSNSILFVTSEVGVYILHLSDRKSGLRETHRVILTR
ncbi:T9SS type A sorting domain-containing protein [Phaeocystidibacter luteus]|uniref:T9SS type A sorting domain-containing protein n=1 Tax=Phaeocystidibacter luteus TaxID=911197 RepID=A0A6N6RJG0_9FLAO|nr:T9SS type A sorting domain-containing protein [Phaeocystidibacter luteus]KAB2813843.1 T9SS type A sorting domain-containing protein [Phaeocystidibacter luteus]